MQNYNLERTRAPRRRIPWWLYVGAVLFVALVIWGIVHMIPGNKADEADATATETISMAPPAAMAAPEIRAAPPSPPPPVRETARPPAPTTRSTPAPAPAPTPTSTPHMQEAIAAKNAGDYENARIMALAVLKNTPPGPRQQEVEALLNEISMELLLTPRPMQQKIEYVVSPGDSLDKIAKKFGTTIELIRLSNNIRGSIIRAGDRLRIFQGKFSVQVSKSDNDLLLLVDNEFFKRYRVGTGAYNKTPVGDFVINDRIAQPTWWRPDGKAIPYGDKENLLGTHWLSINVKGYGLHGTWEPDTIGKQASAGCVRMLNEDIEQLFNILPLGTPVSIRD